MSQNRSTDLDMLAKGYVEILRRGVSTNERGKLFQNLFLREVNSYLPSSVCAIQRTRIGNLTTRWHLVISRGRYGRGVAPLRTISLLDVVGLFEVRAYGTFSVAGLKGPEAVEVALSRKRESFMTAQKSCPNLRLSCYFSLQERTPKSWGLNRYYERTKCVLEPEIMTVIPFHDTFKPDGPLPPMYPSGQAEWDCLVDRLVHL